MPGACWLLKAPRISAVADRQPRFMEFMPCSRVLGIHGAVGGCTVRWSFGMHQKNQDSRFSA